MRREKGSGEGLPKTNLGWLGEPDLPSFATMPHLSPILRQHGLSLIASLPVNSADLARAAVESGAEALKVHIRVQHAASGNVFGSLEEEAPRLEAIRQAALSIPIGVVVGDGRSMAEPAEFAALATMGFDFFDAYAHHMPAWMLAYGQRATGNGQRVLHSPFSILHSPFEIMAAIASDYSDGQVRQLAHRVDMLEAAIVPELEYGAPLSARDIAGYAVLVGLADRPIVVPTQKAVQPQDLPVLRDTGVAAIMIGAIVAGTTPQSWARACGAFRTELDRL